MSGNAGAWKPGESGNRSGRPKGQRDAAKAIARRIQADTRDGAELVDFALAILRHNPTNAAECTAVHGLAEVTLRDKRWAMDWLTDRGFGKPIQPLDLVDEPEAVAPLDLSNVSDEDLAVLERVLRGLGDGA